MVTSKVVKVPRGYWLYPQSSMRLAWWAWFFYEGWRWCVAILVTAVFLAIMVLASTRGASMGCGGCNTGFSSGSSTLPQSASGRFLTLTRSEVAGSEKQGSLWFSSDSLRGVVASPLTNHPSLTPATIKLSYRNPLTLTAPEPVVPVVRSVSVSCAEVQAAMGNQGFTDAQSRVGAGIVMAESRGRLESLAVTPTEHSVGIWQINLLAHPTYSSECARDLMCSTAIAWKISNHGTNWHPWSVYERGTYLNYCA